MRSALLCLALSLTAASARAQEPSAGNQLVAPQMQGEPEVPYPAGAHGDVTVTVIVTVAADGAVKDAKARDAAEPFASAAENAIRASKFSPALRDGKPIAARIKVEIVFHEPPPPEAATPTPTPTPTPPPAPPPDVKEVVVRGAHVDPGRSASLTRTEVRQIPGTFGDPFRAIEVLPGVTPIVTGLPFFFIRGAPPGNVGYYLDGIRVPLLFHVGVGPSVIHPALIERVDLYPGGYPARFGRFAGGIVYGETGQPDTELHGEYNVRLFDIGAEAETGFAGGKGTVLLAGRYSYTAALLTLFSSGTTLDYWDYQARVTYDVTPDDRIGIFGFGSYDFLGQKTATGDDLTVFGTQFHRADLRYDHRISDDATVRTAVTLGLDRSEASEGRFVRDRLAGARNEIEWRTSPKLTVRAGTDLQLDTYDIQIKSGTLAPTASAAAATLFPTRTDFAFGARADAIWQVAPRLEVTPGMRADLFTSKGASAIGLDPRLALRTTVSNRVKWLAALGIAHQAPAFVVPVPGFQPGGLSGGLQKAYQTSTGVEVDLGGQTIATANVYHNAFYDMSDPLGATQPEIGGCPPGLYPSDTLGGDRASQPNRATSCGDRFTPGTLGPDRTGGGGQAASSRGTDRNVNALEVRTRGNAYGLELMVKRKLTSRIGGFFSYTLSRSTRTSGTSTYIASFDRTHVLNAAVAFDLGRNWRAGSRVTFYTGLPKAPDPSSDSTRLSPFFRLDLRLEKRWQLSQKAWISFVAEWMNVTLSKEAVSTECTLDGCNEQLIGPVTIPSLGVEGGF